MKNRIEYSDGPIEEVRIVADFLPEPKELVFREETVDPTTAASSVEQVRGQLKPAQGIRN